MTEVFSLPAFLITYAVLQTFVFLLLIRLLDLYEHEPLSGLAAMCLWGAVGATALSAIFNQVVRDALPDDVDAALGVGIGAPIVEELAKSAIVLIAIGMALWASKQYGFAKIVGPTDGLVYGAAAGLGFAFTEDIHYLFSDVETAGIATAVADFVSRRDFFGYSMLHHAIYTGIVGAALGLATLSRRWVTKIAWSLGGLLLAMVLHAINNGGIQLLLTMEHGLERTAAAMSSGELPRDMSADFTNASRIVNTIDAVMVFGFLVAIVLWLRRQRQIIREELPAEVESGLIDVRDWQMVPHYRDRLKHYWELVRFGELERARVTRRLHIELANLAFAKWEVKKKGTEDDVVDKIRQRIANVKAAQTVDVYAPR